jgi:peptidoglycan/LPS O-acetylase OafA/YrhL
MLRMACEFGAGCLLCRAVANGVYRLPTAADIGALALILVATICGGALTYLILPAFALVVLLAVQESPTSRILSMAPVVFLGEISYSVYLLHFILIQGSRWYLADWLEAPVRLVIWRIGVLLVCIGISTLTYRWIERPARAWGRTRIAKAGRPQPQDDLLYTGKPATGFVGEA